MSDSDDGAQLVAAVYLIRMELPGENATGPKFVVQSRGSTKRTYDVQMVEANCSIFCTCSVCLRKDERCAHLLFIMGRVLGLPQADLNRMTAGDFQLGKEVYQRALEGLKRFCQHRKLYRAHCAVCLGAFAEDYDAGGCSEEVRVYECLSCLAACHQRCHNRRGVPAKYTCAVCPTGDMMATRSRVWNTALDMRRPEVRKAPPIPPSLRPPPRVHVRAPKRVRSPSPENGLHAAYPDFM
jgi:hypothetical protein